ncbi:MAG: YggS family pyridoxal phosphate-dependent enzyme, partial [Pyrinomonadaceae bacterium]
MIELSDASARLGQRLDEVRRKIETAARRCGRDPKEITLVAVSKTHPVEILLAAIANGVTDFGENRVQEAESKIPRVGHKAARWHLIGHLQTNKANRAVKLFDIIHTLDSVSLAERLDRLCAEGGRDKLDVLVQVDLGGETTKSGVSARELPELFNVVSRCSRLRLRGLMTLPPFFEDSAGVRPYFRSLRELRDKLAADGLFGESQGELSMGMS